MQQSTYTVQQSCTQHFNIHDATKLHATMLFATLLHGKFNIHDATKLQATVACNFVASCMVGFICITQGPELIKIGNFLRLMNNWKPEREVLLDSSHYRVVIRMKCSLLEFDVVGSSTTMGSMLPALLT